MKSYLLPKGQSWGVPWRERIRRKQQAEVNEEARRQIQRELGDLYLRYLRAVKDRPAIRQEPPAELPRNHEALKREFDRTA